MSVNEKLNQFTLSKHFVHLFESTSGVLLFIKDENCKLISANTAFMQHLDIKNTDEEIGLSDFDLFPVELAERYYEDDLDVLATGESKIVFL